jgi:dihydrodipicolinate synthase/N-acetylneuraminate lyase
MDLATPAIIPALLTPFRPDGTVDRDALRAHVGWLIDHHVDGIMPCGTTGETALLEADEVIAVVATVVEAARGRVPVVAHVGRPSTPATAKLIERAIDAGAEGVSAIVPYYYAFGDREIRAHFRALLKVAGETPLLAYNFPARTTNDLSAEVFGSLVGEGLAGLKDSTGSLERQEAYLAAAPDAQVFVGSPSLMLGALRMGARGSVAALANLRPDLIVELAQAWLDRHDD